MIKVTKNMSISISSGQIRCIHARWYDVDSEEDSETDENEGEVEVDEESEDESEED